MSQNNFSRTGGYRIGTVPLFQDWNADFYADHPTYQKLYDKGFRAFQHFLIASSDAYLADFRKWADDQSNGDVEISGLLAFIEGGLDGACPISASTLKRQRAMDQVQQTIDKCQIVQATGIHGPLFQGLLNGALNDIPRTQQIDYCIEFIQYVDRLATLVRLPFGWEVLNMHEYPPPGPTTLHHADLLFSLANVSGWMKLLLDTCHQGQGEPSTVAAWNQYGVNGSCIHFSDYGRTQLGREQAFSPAIFDFLVEKKLPLTIYVEGVGKDVPPFIMEALHVNRLPEMTGVEVQVHGMRFIENQFATAALRAATQAS